MHISNSTIILFPVTLAGLLKFHLDISLSYKVCTCPNNYWFLWKIPFVMLLATSHSLCLVYGLFWSNCTQWYIMCAYHNMVGMHTCELVAAQVLCSLSSNIPWSPFLTSQLHACIINPQSVVTNYISIATIHGSYKMYCNRNSPCWSFLGVGWLSGQISAG